jgi:hypothetical protein
MRLGDASIKVFSHGGDKGVPDDEPSAEYHAEKLGFDMTMEELDRFGDIKFVSPRRSVELNKWTQSEYLAMVTGCGFRGLGVQVREDHRPRRTA